MEGWGLGSVKGISKAQGDEVLFQSPSFTWSLWLHKTIQLWLACLQHATDSIAHELHHMYVVLMVALLLLVCVSSCCWKKGVLFT